MSINNVKKCSKPLNDPQILSDNCMEMIENISNIVHMLNQQIEVDEKDYIEELKKRRAIAIRMTKAQEEQIKIYDSCIALCEDIINNGDDVDGSHKKKMRCLERMKKNDTRLLVKLQLELRIFDKNISDIEKLISNMEE